MPHTFVATFFTHFDAVQFGRRAKQKGIEAKLMPVPRKVSSSCGTGAQFQWEDAQFPPELVADGVHKIFRCEGQQYLPCYDADEA